MERMPSDVRDMFPLKENCFQTRTPQRSGPMFIGGRVTETRLRSSGWAKKGTNLKLFTSHFEIQKSHESPGSSSEETCGVSIGGVPSSVEPLHCWRGPPPLPILNPGSRVCVSKIGGGIQILAMFPLVSIHQGLPDKQTPF